GAAISITTGVSSSYVSTAGGCGSNLVSTTGSATVSSTGGTSTGAVSTGLAATGARTTIGESGITDSTNETGAWGSNGFVMFEVAPASLAFSSSNASKAPTRSTTGVPPSFGC